MARRKRTALALALAAITLAGCAEAAAPEDERETAASSAPAAGGRASDDPASDAPASSARPSRTTPDSTLLVTDFGSDTVTFVDPGKGAQDSVEVGKAPYGLAVDGEGRAWVATAEGVAVVDTRSHERIDRIPYRTEDLGPATTGEYRGGGMGIALSPDGERAYVGVNVPSGDGTLEIIDTDAREVVDTAGVGRRPFDVDVSRNGGEVYVTAHDSFDVTVVPVDGDGVDGRTRRIEVAPYGTEGGLGSWLKPHYTAVRDDGRLLLPFEGERLVVVDPRTGSSTVEKMTANTHQHGAALTGDGTLLVVGTGPIDPSADKGPSLTVRPEDGKERVVPLDGPHEDVTASPDGRTAYVTGGFTRDGYWNGITVVDLDTGDTRRLAAGERPLGVAVL